MPLPLPTVVCTAANDADVASNGGGAGAGGASGDGTGGDELSKELCELMARLWRDPATQLAYRLSNRYQLYDSAAYYLNALDRLAAPGMTQSQFLGSTFEVSCVMRVHQNLLSNWLYFTV